MARKYPWPNLQMARTHRFCAMIYSWTIFGITPEHNAVPCDWGDILGRTLALHLCLKFKIASTKRMQIHLLFYIIFLYIFHITYYYPSKILKILSSFPPLSLYSYIYVLLYLVTYTCVLLILCLKFMYAVLSLIQIKISGGPRTLLEVLHITLL